MYILYHRCTCIEGTKDVPASACDNHRCSCTSTHGITDKLLPTHSITDAHTYDIIDSHVHMVQQVHMQIPYNTDTHTCTHGTDAHLHTQYQKHTPARIVSEMHVHSHMWYHINITHDIKDKYALVYAASQMQYTTCIVTQLHTPHITL